MEFDHAEAAAGEEIGPSPEDGLARGAERNPLHGAHGLPVADVAEGVPTAQYDPAILLCLANGWHVARSQPSPSHGGARSGGTRGRPNRRRDRQPVGENHGKRRYPGL